MVARQVHVHIENSHSVASVFCISPEQYRAALDRHSWARGCLRATTGYDLEEFDSAMQTAEILIGSKFPLRDLAIRAPRLKWIHTKGAGIDHLLPLDWLPPEIILTNNRGVHVEKAAEFGWMAILLLNNAVPLHVTNQRWTRWQQVFSTPVREKTLVIIGVGKIGSAVARLAKQFKMRILGIRRTRRPHRHVDEMFGPGELDQVLPRADFVLVAVPLTSETRGLIGQKELDMMRPSTSLINMARAGVMDYEALVNKLQRRELAGAILDVFDPEPLPPDSPLWDTPNLIITPHVSSDDAERYVPRTLDLFFDNLRRYLTGRPLRNRVRRRSEY